MPLCELTSWVKQRERNQWRKSIRGGVGWVLLVFLSSMIAPSTVQTEQNNDKDRK